MNSDNYFDESNSDFYDTEYFISLEYRYFSGAHNGKVENVLSMAGDVSGKKMLDIGCGGGFFTNEFHKQGADIAGIDYAKHGIAFAKSRFPGIDFAVCSAYALKDFKENEFDMILLLDVIEHVRDQIKVLNEIKRVLKPNGLLVISTDIEGGLWFNKFVFRIISFSHIFSKEGRAYRLIKRVESHRRKFKDYHKSHCNAISFESLKNILEKTNFKIKEHRAYPFVRVPVRDIFLKLLPMKYRGNHQCIIANNIK